MISPVVLMDRVSHFLRAMTRPVVGGLANVLPFIDYGNVKSERWERCLSNAQARFWLLENDSGQYGWPRVLEGQGITTIWATMNTELNICLCV